MSLRVWGLELLKIQTRPLETTPYYQTINIEREKLKKSVDQNGRRMPRLVRLAFLTSKRENPIIIYGNGRAEKGSNFWFEREGVIETKST